MRRRRTRRSGDRDDFAVPIWPAGHDTSARRTLADAEPGLRLRDLTPMLTLAGENLPLRVVLRLDPDESVVATIHGLLESGFALTGLRLFAWRSTGTSLPLPLAGIDRILVD